jgi:hypothetical protein
VPSQFLCRGFFPAHQNWHATALIVGCRQKDKKAVVNFVDASTCFCAMYCNVPRIVPSAVTALFIVGSCDSRMTGDTSCISFAEPKSSSFVPD